MNGISGTREASTPDRGWTENIYHQMDLFAKGDRSIASGYFSGW